MGSKFSNSFRFDNKDCKILNGGFVGDLVLKLPYPKAGCERFYRFECLPNDWIITNRRSSFQDNQLVDSVGIYVIDKDAQIAYSIDGEFADIFLISKQILTAFRMRKESTNQNVIDKIQIDWSSGKIFDQEIILGHKENITSIQFNYLNLDTAPNPKKSLVINPTLDGKSDYKNTIQWDLISESEKSNSEILELKSLVNFKGKKYFIDDNSIWKIYLELPTSPLSRKGDYYPVHYFSIDLREFGAEGVILLNEYEHSKGGGFYDGLLKFDGTGNRSFHIEGEYVNWVSKDTPGSGLFLKLTQGIYDLDLDKPIFSLNKIDLKKGTVKSIREITIDSKERNRYGFPREIRYLGFQFKDNKLICRLGFDSSMRTVDWIIDLLDR